MNLYNGLCIVQKFNYQNILHEFADKLHAIGFLLIALKIAMVFVKLETVFVSFFTQGNF